MYERINAKNERELIIFESLDRYFSDDRED